MSEEREKQRSISQRGIVPHTDWESRFSPVPRVIHKGERRQKGSHKQEYLDDVAVPGWYGQLVSDLNVIATSGKPLLSENNGVLLTHNMVLALRDKCIGPREVKAHMRLGKLRREYDSNDAFVRWLGGKLRPIPALKDKRNSEIEELARRAIPVIRRFGEFLPNTPLSWFTETAPVHEVLQQSLLDQTLESVILSEDTDSVAATLSDPIELSINGILIKTNPIDEDDERNHGFILPKQLLEIVSSLKYDESNRVLEDWILAQCLDNNNQPNNIGAQNTLRFLQILINFTTFLDSRTHLELHAPPKVEGRNKEEILINPFYGLRNCLGNIARQLYPHFRNSDLHNRYRDLITTMELRYGEIYSGAKQSSLFTADVSALIPKPRDFARSMIRLALRRNDPERTALGIVKIAESTGIEDISPLVELLLHHQETTEELISDSQKENPSDKIKSLESEIGELDVTKSLQHYLKNQIKLRLTLVREAEIAGLFDSPTILQEVRDELKDHPWQEISNVNWADVIKPETTDIIFYVLTGTFGHCTSGHFDLIDRTLKEMNSAPEKIGNKIYQRLFLIMPITDSASISSYKKDVARTGTIEERASSVALQLSLAGFDKNQVFIVTTQQSHPGRHKDTRDGVRTSCNVIFGKIVESLEEADRSAALEYSMRFVLGPDELEWIGNPRRLAPAEEQRRKVTEPNGIVVVRRGWFLATLRECDQIAKQTGITEVILTPGTPNTSSEESITYLNKTGIVKSSRSPAKWYIKNHWIDKATEARRLLPPSPDYIPLMTQINRKLLEELDIEIKKKSSVLI